MTKAIAVTGANGFIGKNLVQRLTESGFEVRSISHTAGACEIDAALAGVGVVFHLAAVHRVKADAEFAVGNSEFTQLICERVKSNGAATPVVYTSSIQAERDNPYGRSKHAAEDIVAAYARSNGARAFVFRLPNVFGKWSRPNYNSAVATFCHNIARGLPIEIHDAAAPLKLLYIDDLMERFIEIARDPATASTNSLGPVYETTVGDVARQIEAFRHSRHTLTPGKVGIGLTRALYSTYVSYLPTEAFDYPLEPHADPRGVFVEMLRTPDSGQFSYFTAFPGVTRGSHYHHSKTEKFLVLEGKARFGFRHLISGERHELFTTGDVPRVVETIPGWVHDITNIGDSKMIVMIWANEVFDRNAPDTISQKV